MAPKPPPDLGDLERDVMRLVWRQGKITAEAARELLGRPLKESTIRTVLRRLEEKGFVSHSVEGRTFVYRAAEARSLVAARAVKRVVDWFCDGAIEEVLVGMVDSKMLGSDQLRELSEKIAKAKTGQK
jgi:BlaI family transcriptional regulator, penicillinase repressor